MVLAAPLTATIAAMVTLSCLNVAVKEKFIQENLIFPLCPSEPCENGGTCTDIQNATGVFFNCSCAPGYEGDLCETDINECASDPCQNGGTCTDQVNGFNCECAAGWSDAVCDFDIVECASEPCLNGGTCTHGIDQFNCVCVAGYTGIQCETDIDECASDPCQNGGTCTDLVNGYNCSCISGWEGSECQTETNECDSNPCQNGATCNDLFDSYNCTCAAGYEGTLCQTDIDECASDPCQNGGTCTDQVNGYSCGCVAGWEGTECQTDTDECASDPCQNGATCNDYLNYYNCSCVAGYEGTLCQTDTDECASNPCQNGATCNDQVNGYNCACAAGWEGTECQTDTDECASDPCQNGGTCNDYLALYNCTCVSGYEGSDCETFVGDCVSSPCQNGATCEPDMGGGYNCSCAPGYEGTHCETDINYCDGDPCTNGGTCVDNQDHYSCTCTSDYLGDECQIPVVFDPVGNFTDNQSALAATGGPGSVSMSADGNRLVQGLGNGDVRIYARTGPGDDWVQEGSDLSPSDGGTTSFGTNVDMDDNGKTIVVSDYGDDSGRGACWVFTRNGTTWSQLGLKLRPSGATTNNWFTGCIISHDGRRFAGAANSGSPIEGMHVYVRSGDEFVLETGGLFHSSDSSHSPFPRAFGDDGTTLIAGLSNYNSYRGAVATFTRSGSTWSQSGGLLQEPVPGINNYFGFDAALSFDQRTLVVTSNTYTGYGEFFIFNWTGAAWDMIQNFDYAGVDGLGHSVAINSAGDLIAVGASQHPSPGTDYGAVYIYSESGGTWTRTQILTNYGYLGTSWKFLGAATAMSRTGQALASSTRDGGHVMTWVREVEDGCASDPCQSGGTCTDGIGLYTCACASGYEGSDCEILVGDCVSSPCQNGATCEPDAGGGYNCSCSPGYEGTHCETDINYCDGDPCANGGTCVDNQDHYSCTCTSDYLGDECQIPVVYDPVGNFTDNQTAITGGGSDGCVSMSADGNRFVQGDAANDKFTIYSRTGPGEDWTAETSPIGPSDGSPSYFGSRVSMDDNGKTVVISDWNADSGRGGCWVFTRSGTTWSQLGLKIVPSGVTTNDYFGWCIVSPDGRRFAGAAYAGTPIEGMHVYVRSGDEFVLETGGLMHSSAPSDVPFPKAFSDDGATIIAGMAGYSSKRGAVATFTRSGSTWSQSGGLLQEPVPTVDQQFGTAAALSRDQSVLVVGGSHFDGYGELFIHNWTGAAWDMIQSFSYGETDGLGDSVAINAAGTLIAAGAIKYDTPGTDYGAVFIFSESGGTWTRTQVLTNYGYLDITWKFNGFCTSMSRTGQAVAAVTRSSGNVMTWVREVEDGCASSPCQNGGVCTDGISEYTCECAASYQGTNCETFSVADFSLHQPKLNLADTASTSEGYGVSLSGDGLRLAQGGAFYDLPVSNFGMFSVYSRSGTTDNFTDESGLLQGATGGTNETLSSMGASVALDYDGDTLVVSAYRDGSNDEGAVWVYTRTGSTWTPQGSKITPAVSSGNFGRYCDVSDDGNTFVASQSQGGAGEVHVYTRSGETWSAHTSNPLIPSDGVALGNVGCLHLSGDGSTLVVGFPFAYNDGTASGAAWVFVDNGTAWVQQGAYINATISDASDNFGTGCAISYNGDVIAVGIADDTVLNNAGAVVVFQRSGETWTEVAIVRSDSPELSDYLVQPILSANATVLAVAGYYAGPSNAGVLEVFSSPDVANWTKVGSDLVPVGYVGTTNFGRFSSGVSMDNDGSVVAVGADADDSSKGAVFVYSNV